MVNAHAHLALVMHSARLPSATVFKIHVLRESIAPITRRAKEQFVMHAQLDLLEMEENALVRFLRKISSSLFTQINQVLFLMRPSISSSYVHETKIYSCQHYENEVALVQVLNSIIRCN